MYNILRQEYMLIQFIAGILRLFYKIMNSNPNPQNLFACNSPFFKCEPSPYLSPLYGSISNIQQSSHDDLNDFCLEQEPAFPIGGELQLNCGQPSLSQILLNTQEVEDIVLEKIQIETPEKNQIQTPYFFPSSNKSKVYQIISFLSSNDHLPERDLLTFGKQLYENSNQLQFVFRTLLVKFLKLKKTKEEMVKYCMRKAFKFIGDAKKQKNGKGKKDKTEKKLETEAIFTLPFKKNCSEKTMNSQYLKQVFSNPQFLTYYRQFLNSIQQIIEQDNNCKIQYLSDSIQKLIGTNNLSQVQKIKRLPWNKTILKRTSDLAKTLLDFSTNMENHEEVFCRQSQNQQQD